MNICQIIGKRRVVEGRTDSTRSKSFSRYLVDPLRELGSSTCWPRRPLLDSTPTRGLSCPSRPAPAIITHCRGDFLPQATPSSSWWAFVSATRCLFSRHRRQERADFLPIRFYLRLEDNLIPRELKEEKIQERCE